MSESQKMKFSLLIPATLQHICTKSDQIDLKKKQKNPETSADGNVAFQLWRHLIRVC